jgi:hypothetical protein
VVVPDDRSYSVVDVLIQVAEDGVTVVAETQPLLVLFPRLSCRLEGTGPVGLEDMGCTLCCCIPRQLLRFLVFLFAAFS